MQHSIVMLTFSVLAPKDRFWTNIVQKIKMVSLSSNLVPSLIRAC